MKKKFLAVLTASAMLFSMAGCGIGEGSGDADSSGDAQAEDAGRLKKAEK